MGNKCIAVIPALNEEETIGKVLKDLRSYVDEIIVVNDGSTDNTQLISEKYAVVIKHSKNKGYDTSINDGFRMANHRKADIIVTLDADGQHFADDIPRLIEPILKNKADIVVGIRPYRARLMEYVFAWYGKKKGISDPLCGMKAYKTEVYNDIGFFDNIQSIGTQLVFSAQKKGYRINEIPIRLRKRRDVPRFGRVIKANMKMFFALLRLVKFINKLT